MLKVLGFNVGKIKPLKVIDSDPYCEVICSDQSKRNAGSYQRHSEQVIYTGMDKTSLYTSSGSLFVRDSVHVTSNVITYHCSAGRRRGTIDRRLTLLRNT